MDGQFVFSPIGVSPCCLSLGLLAVTLQAAHEIKCLSNGWSPLVIAPSYACDDGFNLVKLANKGWVRHSTAPYQ